MKKGRYLFFGIIAAVLVFWNHPKVLCAGESDFAFIEDVELGGYLITGYHGADTNPQLPTSYNNKPVIGIGKDDYERDEKRVFEDTGVVEVIIPDSYTIIQTEGLADCTTLESVTIGTSVTDVMYDAFYGSNNIKTLIIKSSNIKFYEYSLQRCTAENLIFSDEVTTLPKYAKGYYNMPKLKNIVIGNSVTDIPMDIFSECPLLESVTIGNGVRTIRSSAFYNCPSLKNVTFGEAVQTIEESAFADCTAITELELKAQLATVKSQAFSGCTGLKQLTINSAYEADSFCFGDVKLDKLTITDSAMALPENGCPQAVEVVLGANITEIPSMAFENCSILEKITFPSGLKKIGESAFKGCDSLEEVNLPYGLEEIAYRAFHMCTGLKEVVIPAGLEVLGKSSFEKTGIESITIGEGTCEIADSVIAGCDNLHWLIVEGKDTDISTMIASGDEHCEKVTIIAPEGSLAEAAAYKNGYRCTDSLEFEIDWKNLLMYAEEVRLVQIYNDAGEGVWSSSDESVISVNQNGRMTAKSTGTATITVMVDGVFYSREFSVLERTTDNVLKVIFEYYITEDMSDYERIIVFNRWLWENATYDTNYENEKGTTMDGIFEDGLAVCDGFTRAAIAVLNKCGIVNEYVIGVVAGELHSWNLIQIGGEWYHWDPTWSMGGDEFCLVTDEVMENGHTWDKESYPSADCAAINKTVISSRIHYVYEEDINAGSVINPNPIGYTTEMEPLVLEEPYLYSHHFMGWYLEPSYENKVTQLTKGKGEITLYGKWEEHSYDTKKVLAEPTCGDYGEAEYICKCGDSYKKQLPISGEHQMNCNTVKEAACGSKGLKEYTCGICGWSYKEDIAATGKHKYVLKTTKATTLRDGNVSESCTGCGVLRKNTTIYRIKTASLGRTKYVYTGKNCKPMVTVKDRTGNRIANSHYTVKYANNKSVGTATVTVVFKGEKYSGTIKKTFKIIPKPTSVSKLTATKKGFKVKIKKQSKQTSGYEIQYSLKKNMKNAKTVRLKSYKTTSKTIKGLKAKKKYYVRVRTYKKVSGKPIYSEWSKVKTVKTK